MDAETRAGDLLDRLNDCGLGGGVTEDDLLGAGEAREPLRTCCANLARQLWGVAQEAGFPVLRELQEAVLAVRHAADAQQASAAGRLDASLAQLARALGGSAAAPGRVDALELATAALQAGSMLVAAAAVEGHGGAGKDADMGGEADGEAMDMVDAAAFELSAALRSIASLLELDAGQPAAAELAAAVRDRVTQLLAQLPAGFFDPLLPLGSLDAEQTTTLADIDAALRAEYALRRRMLIERVKVTLSSFLYSPRLAERGSKDAAQAAAQAAAAHMAEEPRVVVDDVFRATLGDLLSIMERATSGDTGIHASVKGVLIGSVPDRGGRPEGRARDADMPAWSARRASGDRGGRGRGGGGRGGGGRGGGGRGGGGGRVQGGWTGGGGGGRGGGGGWGNKRGAKRGRQD
eukprot:scaffold4.g5046.t1